MQQSVLFTMVCLTSRQMIRELKSHSGIILGGKSYNKLPGLSNDFYVERILSKVKEELPTLHWAFKKVSKDRTLWLITSTNLDVFDDNKLQSKN
ncbi:hypothetical protein [Tenacibaculum sp.]|uniref:hypothetical protein n=1 Tax=Tenacibaculum sp. TaxID=1906242 RepID=UPI003D125D28